MIIKGIKDIPKLKYKALELEEDGTIVDRTVKRDDSSEETYTYNTRGMLPNELNISQLISGFVPPPMPPTKTVEVKPLDARNRIIPEEIKDEEKLDYEDVDYKKRVAEWSQANSEQNQLVLVYQLICAVEGFNPTDQEIEELTGKKPPADDPTKMPVFKQRLGLIGQILLSRIPNPHLTQIMRRITEQTGLSDVVVNFT